MIIKFFKKNVHFYLDQWSSQRNIALSVYCNIGDKKNCRYFEGLTMFRNVKSGPHIINFCYCTVLAFYASVYVCDFECVSYVSLCVCVCVCVTERERIFSLEKENCSVRPLISIKKTS